MTEAAPLVRVRCACAKHGQAAAGPDAPSDPIELPASLAFLPVLNHHTRHGSCDLATTITTADGTPLADYDPEAPQGVPRPAVEAP